MAQLAIGASCATLGAGGIGMASVTPQAGIVPDQPPVTAPLAPAPARKVGARSTILLIALIVVAAVISYINRQILPVLKPDISAELHWTDRQYGALAAWTQFAGAAALLLFGSLVDRLGARWSGPATVLAWSAAAIGHLWASSFVLLVMLRIVTGATQALGTPVVLKSIKRFVPADQVSLAFGTVNAACILGAVLAPLGIPFFAAAFGWRNLFAIVGATGCLWTLAWLALVRHVEDRGESRTAAPPLTATTLSRRRLWALAIAKFLADATWWLVIYWLPDYLHRQFGLSTRGLAVPLAVIYAIGALGSFASGIVASRLAAAGHDLATVRRRTLMVAAAMALAFPLAANLNDIALATIVIGFVLAAHQIFAVTLFAIMTDASAEHETGRVVSFATFMGNVGGIVIVWIAGRILSAGFGYQSLFLGCALTYSLATIWLLWRLPEYRRGAVRMTHAR